MTTQKWKITKKWSTNSDSWVLLPYNWKTPQLYLNYSKMNNSEPLSLSGCPITNSLIPSNSTVSSRGTGLDCLSPYVLPRGHSRPDLTCYPCFGGRSCAFRYASSARASKFWSHKCVAVACPNMSSKVIKNETSHKTKAWTLRLCAVGCPRIWSS